MKSAHGQVTKILCGIYQGRQLRVDRWAQHSEASLLPALCQELDRRSYGEADWHFFAPMCFISVATSRHVRHELYSVNAAPSNWHMGTVMGVNEWAVLGADSGLCLFLLVIETCINGGAFVLVLLFKVHVVRLLRILFFWRVISWSGSCWPVMWSISRLGRKVQPLPPGLTPLLQG